MFGVEALRSREAAQGFPCFGVLKRLGWVEATNQTEPSSLQENHPPAPDRIYYRAYRTGPGGVAAVDSGEHKEDED